MGPEYMLHQPVHFARNDTFFRSELISFLHLFHNLQIAQYLGIEAGGNTENMFNRTITVKLKAVLVKFIKVAVGIVGEQAYQFLCGGTAGDNLCSVTG